MGNDFNLTKSCVGASQLCTQQFHVQQRNQKSIKLKRKNVKSTEEIRQKILKYIDKNRLQIYSTREKKVLETLVSIDQQHVSDKVVQMDKKLRILQQQKRQLSRKDKINIVNDKNQTQKKDSQQADKKAQKLSKVTLQLSKLTQKRKKLFEQAQCLLLEDLDMIFQQIPNFDQNYHFVNNIISLSQTLNKAQEQIQRQNKVGLTQTSNSNNSSLSNFNSGSNLRVSATNAEKESKISHSKSKIFHPLESRKEKKYQERLKQALRMEDKKVLKKKSQIARLGAQILSNNDLLMIVPIQCFNGIGALENNNKTSLPSGASLLQILANKIKAVNMRRGCTLGLCFLVNEKYEQKFKQQIRKTLGFQDYDCDRIEMSSNIQNLSDANSQPLSYNVIPFRNIWPSFDNENKIILNQQDQGGINFTSHDGDLIGFIQNSMQLKSLIEKYQYINLTNINNMLSQIGDAYCIGYLEQNQQLDIVTKILKPEKEQIELKEYFQLDQKGFVNILEKQVSKVQPLQQQIKNIKQQKSYIKNAPFLNTEEYYVRSRIFTTDSGPLKRLLMSRITRFVDPDSAKQSLRFYLHRPISSMFFYKFSAFILVDEENEFSHVRRSFSHFYTNGQIGYSRYCKKLLGLKQSQIENQEQEMVQIDSGILHKGSQQMVKILKQLRKVKEVGFPIILYSSFFNNQKQA